MSQMERSRNFLIMPNVIKPEALQFTGELSAYLLKRGQKVFLPVEFKDCFSGCSIPFVDAHEMNDMDIAVALGGDGTVLRSVRHIVSSEREIPLLAVNFGHLGYLTECSPEEAFAYIDRILSGNYKIERRTLIQGSLIREGVERERFIAVNEAVINRCAAMRPLALKLSLNGNQISSFNADGIMAATPTGSTAYNLSAGGPLLTPCSDNIVITPICSISALQCSIVTPAHDVIEMTLERFANPQDDGMYANISVDSILNYTMVPMDCLRLTRSEKSASFIKINETSFYTALQKKLSMRC